MARVDAASGTVYVNSAEVPRIREFSLAHAAQGAAAGGDGEAAAAARAAAAAAGAAAAAAGPQQEGQQRVRGHHFLVAEVSEGALASARNVWVGVAADAGGAPSRRRCFRLAEEELVVREGRRCSRGGGWAYRVFDAHAGRWETVQCQGAAAAGAAVPCG